MKKFLFLFVIFSFSLFATEKHSPIVCIHGFMGGPWCMHFIAKNLVKDGWHVINWSYPSRNDSIQAHAEKLIIELNCIVQQYPNEPIHFVTHSMGSLVLLKALQHQDCPKEAKIGKVVLMAPPAKGSIFARWLHKFAWARWIAKEFAGKELMTTENFEGEKTYPESLNKILVIAGTFGINPICKGENDGTVGVNETFLTCPHEHISVRWGHKTMIFSKKVCGVIRSFFLEDSQTGNK